MTVVESARIRDSRSSLYDVPSRNRRRPATAHQFRSTHPCDRILKAKTLSARAAPRNSVTVWRDALDPRHQLTRRTQIIAAKRPATRRFRRSPERHADPREAPAHRAAPRLLLPMCAHRRSRASHATPQSNVRPTVATADPSRLLRRRLWIFLTRFRIPRTVVASGQASLRAVGGGKRKPVANDARARVRSDSAAL